MSLSMGMHREWSSEYLIDLEGEWNGHSNELLLGLKVWGRFRAGGLNVRGQILSRFRVRRRFAHGRLSLPSVPAIAATVVSMRSQKRAPGVSEDHLVHKQVQLEYTYVP